MGGGDGREDAAGTPDDQLPDSGLDDPGVPIDGGSDSSSDSGTDAGAPPSCSNIVGSRATQVCLRWKCDRQDRSEGTWTGDLATCKPGDNTKSRANVLKMVNLYRFLADVPPVTTDAQRNNDSQACALLLHANNQISHKPPSSWACYTAAGAKAAGMSNVSGGPGVRSVDLYMVDYGNETTFGHRRRILKPSLGPIGSGSTSSYSCMWVEDEKGTAKRDFVAFPSPGPFPLEAFSPFVGVTVNDIGWSIQSDTINFSGATITIKDLTAGTNRAVKDVAQLANDSGSGYAIRFKPSGWLPEAGHTYRVSVGAIASPFSYDIEVLDCG